MKMKNELSYQEMEEYYREKSYEWVTMASGGIGADRKELEFQPIGNFRVTLDGETQYEGSHLRLAVEQYNS